MPSEASRIFQDHIKECREAIAIYDHVRTAMGFQASFSLRFVWIATVSALDHYVSQLILERATNDFGNNKPLQGKLLSDVMTFSSAIEFRSADPVQSVVTFRAILDRCVRYKSFQSPDSISDGLSYIWARKGKWDYISSQMGRDAKSVKRKLSAIVDRRNLIAHNGDFDEGLGAKLRVERADAVEVIDFISQVVTIIDFEVAG